MLQQKKVPYTLQWVIRLFVLYIIIFTLFRISSYLIFNPDKFTAHGEGGARYPFIKMLPAFALGMAYDARWICIILSPIVIASIVPQFTPFKNKVTKSFWSVYLVIATFFILFFFGADFGHFQYVRTRLNASALNFFEDAKISLQMLWESYPILWLFIGLAVLIIVLTLFINRTYFKIVNNNSGKSKFDYQRRWYIVTIAVFVYCIYGIGFLSPLTREDSFRKMDDEFKGFLALNPFQNFFSTLRFRNPAFKGNQVNETKRFELYPEIASMLQLNPSLVSDTSYTRVIQNNVNSTSPNVVLVMCESLSTYKTTMGKNTLNATPYLQGLANNSLYFNNCFSPSFGTARGLFAWLTGVPDVQFSMFSSRNALSVKQHTIINDFKNYEKLYFLGGSSEFNNFKGLINNINGVTLYDEKAFKSPKLNVWGISDKNLFLEANNVFKTKTKPFFAVIQTADNHEPYSIAKEDADFAIQKIDKSKLKQNCFNSEEEFNALRYFDYSVAKFMEAAKKEAYFNNTIFVFFGDHGVIGNAGSNYPQVWTDQRLTEEHIPLLFYAPKLIAAQQRNEVVSQIDILPTIASLANQQYTNTSLGRNLLDSNKNGNYAFTIFHDAGKIGLVTDSFYFIHNYNTGDNDLFNLKNNTTVTNSNKEQYMPKYFKIAEGMYETSKWMLRNNK
jgi:phosphoglycerol transferase MdoB-like AlkP superfamily enzyme